MWRPIHDALASRLSGKKALGQACEQNQIERFFTFANFERSAERCAEQMRLAGLSDVEVEAFPADGQTQWSGWRAMKAWNVTAARLWMTEPRRELLADWDQKPQCVVMYSGPCRAEGELVEWNGELDVDLSGKVPFTHHRINDVFPQMRQLGVTAVLSDFIGTLPGVRDASDLPDDVRWENSAIRTGYGAFSGFQLTPRQGEMLRDLLRNGPVHVRFEIDSAVEEGIFKSATGIIPGAERPEEEMLFVSHLYEPGANDNASGVGVGLELARSLNDAIRDGTIPRPRRSIRFLFNWEGYGLYAWMHKHRQRVPTILGGLNIDEIGVDQAKGRSVVHLFMPPAANPSAIGDLTVHLCREILSPRIRWKSVADRAEIINDTITADPNIDVVLPCLIQYPSRNYHSSADTPDTLCPETMAAIGLLSGTHLAFLAGAGPREAAYLASLAAEGCRDQLDRTASRLAEGSWPFSEERTGRWFAEQFQLKAESVARFGMDETQVESLKHDLAGQVQGWCLKHHARFPAEPARAADAALLERAAALVPGRGTLGTPKPWDTLDLSDAEDQAYRKVLFDHNLDMLFHRLIYWANGRRSLLEIVERLEVELDELQRDTAIARTASGSLIAKQEAAQLDLKAVMVVFDLIVASGYLKSAS